MARDDQLPPPRDHGSERAGDDRRVPVFVLRRPDPTGPHVDFGLEIGDVLVSWAVPESPSLDPRDRRLAIRTEDHPIGYDGGSVTAWDTGPFDLLTAQSADRALADGHLTVRLHGAKITGNFSLVRRHSGTGEQWLLTREDDESAVRPAAAPEPA
jgi:DNA ligase D-like protein (predicted 3'-phosphoesterase)